MLQLSHAGDRLLDDVVPTVCFDLSESPAWKSISFSLQGNSMKTKRALMADIVLSDPITDQGRMVGSFELF